MLEQLRPEAARAINLVEELIGVKIIIYIDPQRATEVAMEYISPENGGPTIHIGGDCGPDSSHLVACKAAQILRMYQAAEEQRFLPIAAKQHINHARTQLEATAAANPYVREALQDPNIVQTWVFSLINQLVSQPADIGIQKWVHKEYPGLDDLQQRMIEHQLRDFLSTETEEVRSLSPRLIFDASEIMNTVYLMRIDDVLGTRYADGIIEKIFRRKKTEQLLEQTRKQQTDDLEGDLRTTDAWAEFLKLSDWFGWMPLVCE